MLRDALRRTPVDAVTLVHSETSTGVLQDVAALAAVVREFDDVLLLVDAVTSLAGSPVETDRWGDRKSTRLNSSHLVISYAVFCLKKKKTRSTKSLVHCNPLN